MNEADALAQLRDIHILDDLDRTVAIGFAGWPFVLLGLGVVAIISLRLWNRNQWRRNARADLSRILSVEDPATQWAMLLQFASGLPARPRTLPQTTFMPPDSISDEQRSEFIAFLSAELER